MGDALGLSVSEDFEYLVGFLPEGWESKAKELGALRRARKVPDARTLLRALLVHLGEGCSLRETAARAKQGGLMDVSDVAIMDRLRLSGEWLRWMGEGVMAQWARRGAREVFGEWNVRVVDGTVISEPGPRGAAWRLHYAIDLASLRCRELSVALAKGRGNGEGFGRFAVEPGDLFLGDRAYALAPGVAGVVEAGGHVLARFVWSNLPLRDPAGGAFGLFERLRALRGASLGDWPAVFEHEGRAVAGRVCAIKRSRQAAERARERARRRSQRHGAEIRAETLEAAGYVFVFTTADAKRLGAGRALEFYRGRWQVELAFKRLKSIMGVGSLRKTDPDSSRAWIHGKLLVAFLVEALKTAAESFSPWGYPLRPPART